MEGMPELPKGYYWKLKKAESNRYVFLQLMRKWSVFSFVYSGSCISTEGSASDVAKRLAEIAESLHRGLMREKGMKLMADRLVEEFNEAAKPKRIPYKGRSF